MNIQYTFLIMSMFVVQINSMSSVGEISPKPPFKLEDITRCQRAGNLFYFKTKNGIVYSLKYERLPLEQNYWGRLRFYRNGEQANIYLPEDVTESIFEHCTTVPTDVKLIDQFK